MRRRPPHLIELSRSDAGQLARLVRDGHTEQRVACRARILLAMAEPTTVVQDLAARLEVAPSTIWSLCRRYEQVGIGVVQDAPRSGRPREVSPPDARRD